jgi:competence protein ComEA
MSEKKHELILVAFALVISAILILYNTFTVPSEYIASAPQTSATTTKTQVSVGDAVIVNINTADVEELTLIDGIGRTKAEAIVKYRLENGLFESVDELKNVSGIGEATLRKIYPYVTV